MQRCCSSLTGVELRRALLFSKAQLPLYCALGCLEINLSQHILHCARGVYEEKDDVEGVIRDLAKAELGLSIVVSGVFEEVFDICKRVETGSHMVNLSMRI